MRAAGLVYTASFFLGRFVSDGRDGHLDVFEERREKDDDDDDDDETGIN